MTTQAHWHKGLLQETCPVCLTLDPKYHHHTQSHEKIVSSFMFTLIEYSPAADVAACPGACWPPAKRFAGSCSSPPPLLRHHKILEIERQGAFCFPRLILP